MVVLRAANQNLLIAGGNHTLIPSMNHRRYIGCTIYCVIPFNHTGCIRDVAGGRLPPLRTHRWVVPFTHTGYIRNVPGTAHRPFPTVSLVGIFLNRRIPKRTRPSSITVNCKLSTVNSNQLSIVNCQFKPPEAALFRGGLGFFTVSAFWRFFRPWEAAGNPPGGGLSGR